MDNYRFGNYLYELRRQRGLTQEDLARLIGVTGKAVSKWETGSSKPSIANLQELSDVFDISLDDLLATNGREAKDKKIYKIVLTGGPCAGKSTAMNWIQNYFRKLGYAVLFVPEVATELITGGLAPWNAKSILAYQDCILQLQLAKEKAFEKGALNLPDDKILIVCDRGALDNKAYMSTREFNTLLRLSNLNEVELRDSYDAVFHLVTAAKGAKDFYNLDNQARTENIEQAVVLDKKTVAAWTGHPHLRIIGNYPDFEYKMKQLIKEISHFLGEPEPYEIERKFLIEMPDLEYLSNLPNCEKVSIVQTYLKSDGDQEVRIRQRGADGHYTYSKTKKITLSPTTRIEFESRLSKDEYLTEMFNADQSRGQIIKDRYCLSYGDQYFEIDVFPFWEDKAIAEIELTDENQDITFPEFINVIKEVTDDIDYKNSSLAAYQKKLNY